MLNFKRKYIPTPTILWFCDSKHHLCQQCQTSRFSTWDVSLSLVWLASYHYIQFLPINSSSGANISLCIILLTEETNQTDCFHIYNFDFNQVKFPREKILFKVFR